MNLPSGWGSIAIETYKRETRGTVKGYSDEDRQWFIDNGSIGEDFIILSEVHSIPGIPFIDVCPSHIIAHPENEDYIFIYHVLDGLSPFPVNMEGLYTANDRTTYSNFREEIENGKTFYLCDAYNIREMWNICFAGGYLDTENDDEIAIIVPILSLFFLLAMALGVTKIGRPPQTNTRRKQP